MLAVSRRTRYRTFHIGHVPSTQPLQRVSNRTDASLTDCIVSNHPRPPVHLFLRGFELWLHQEQQRSTSSGGIHQTFCDRGQRNEREVRNHHIEPARQPTIAHHVPDVSRVHLVANLHPWIVGHLRMQEPSTYIARHDMGSSTLQETVHKTSRRCSCIQDSGTRHGHAESVECRFQLEAAPADELGDLHHRDMVARRHLSRRIHYRCPVHRDPVVSDEFVCFFDRARQARRHQRAIDSLRVRHVLWVRVRAEYVVGKCRKILEHAIRGNGAVIGCFAHTREHEPKLRANESGKRTVR